MAQLESVDDRWNALLRLTRSWRLEWNLEQLLSRVAREAVDFLALERSIIFLLEQDGLRPRAAWPAQTLNSPAEFYAQGFRIAQEVVEFGRPVYGHQLAQARESNGARSICCVPLTASRGILGALYADSSRSSASLTQKDQEFLEMLGLQAAVALEHAVLYQSAITDPLTRLFSHRHFQQEVEQAVRRANRSGQPLSLLLMDLDHFKALNDNCGHEAGNQCLVQVSTILRQTLRTSDVLARFGGDEFEILLPDTASDAALAVAEKIRPHIASIPLPQNRQVTATLGVAAFPQNASDAQALFLRADEALYAAKEAGRNRSACSSFKEKGGNPSPILRARADGIDSLTMLMSPRYQKSNPAPVDLQARAAESVDGHPVVKRLGAGSTGEVLLVRQPELHRDVALKRLLTAHVTEAQMRAFEEEARLTASLRHPGIVTIHTMGTDVDGRRYYTMVPLAGLSLADIFERRRTGDEQILKSYSVRRLLEVLQRASETLAYAHQRDVLHLDLSPGNVVVGDFGEVSVIDWGRGAASRAPVVEKGAASESTLSFMVGSPSYLAPERLPGSGSPVGAPADVFALGALLYEVLTGRPPFFNASTREAMDALVKGKIPTPESVVPDAGLDPSITALCMQALALKPDQRPTAMEFSQRLGRHVRNEPEWTVTKFGPGHHPIVASEWQTNRGRWHISGDGVFTPDGADEHTIYWKIPTGGSYRFIAEAWTDSSNEVSLMCNAATKPDGTLAHYGYFFQVGAEGNSCSKFSRFGRNSISRTDVTMEPGRRYILSMEYDEDEGVVLCYLDGKQIFRVREMFPFSGGHVGFYAFYSGAHFRPIEVHSRQWTLHVQRMRVADGHVNAERFKEALEEYREIERRAPKRLEGLEARLKSALCLTELKQPAQATPLLESLFGSPLEPYALAELGLLDMRRQPECNVWRGLVYMRRMVDQYPGHLAGERIVYASELATIQYRPLAKTRQEDVVLRTEVLGLARRTGQGPTFSQIRAQIECMSYLFELGRWRQAYEGGISVYRHLNLPQHQHHSLHAAIYTAALALGIEQPPVELFSHRNSWYVERCDWASSIYIHRLIRTGGGAVEALLGEFQDVEQFKQQPSPVQTALLFAWVENRKFEVAEASIEAFIRSKPTTSEEHVCRAIYLQTCVFTESGEYDRARKILDIARTAKQFTPSSLAVFTAMEARIRLEQGDVEGAARILHGSPTRFDCFVRVEEDTVFQMLCASLGLLTNPSLQTMRAHYPESTCGPERELCEIFLGLREPKPGPTFPHPTWRPEWRLWLALWLEAKGDRQAARQVAEPCIDPRYKRMHSQVALRALLKRVG